MLNVLQLIVVIAIDLNIPWFSLKADVLCNQKLAVRLNYILIENMSIQELLSKDFISLYGYHITFQGSSTIHSQYHNDLTCLYSYHIKKCQTS